MSTGSTRELAAQCPRAQPQRAEPFVGTTRQRRQVHILAAVESEAEREHLIGVAQRVEPAASSTATSSAPRRWLRVTRCRIRTGPIVACDSARVHR